MVKIYIYLYVAQQIIKTTSYINLQGIFFFFKRKPLFFLSLLASVSELIFFHPLIAYL